MKEGRASLTALAVATARGLARTPDPTAPALLPTPLGTALRRWQALPAWTRRIRMSPRMLSGGLVDHLDLRTTAIDQEIARALPRSSALVLLGAGFDGRAYRLPDLSSTTVFEVDHPDTARAKHERARHLRPRCRELVHVTVDFDRTSVADALAAHDHDSTRPTIWVWEGVTPYLPLPAIEHTLDAIARRSAPGSRLLMTYAVPQLAGRPWMDTVVRQGFSWLGEPLRGVMTPEQASTYVARRGFETISDSGQNEWAGQRRLAFHLARPLRAERLLVAERTSSSSTP